MQSNWVAPRSSRGNTAGQTHTSKVQEVPAKSCQKLRKENPSKIQDGFHFCAMYSSGHLPFVFHMLMGARKLVGLKVSSTRLREPDVGAKLLVDEKECAGY